MTINLENESDINLDIDYMEISTKVADMVLECENCPYEVSVNIILTNNQEIKEINSEYRNIDKPTDVLSFPMLSYDKPSDFSFLEEDYISYFDPDSGELLLGDIIISLEKIKEQAENYGHSQMREFAFLIAHSMLHLCGYDHMEIEERTIMEEKQKEVLDKLNILR